MKMVSFIMGVYQENKEHLQLALDSVLQQTYDNLEIIIYIDGEQSDTRVLLEQYQSQDSRIRLIGESQNKGLGYGLNRCIEIARGDYIARMDGDDISESDRVQKQVEFLETHSEYDFVGCNTLLMDERGVYGKRDMKPIPTKEDFYQYLPFIHPSVMFRKEVFAGQHLYPETKATLRCEDMVLFMELYAQGKRGYNLEEYLYRYREDMANYQKKKYKYRMIESQVRWQGYKDMALPTHRRVIYAAKPLMIGLIPKPVAVAIRRRRDAGKTDYDTEFASL